LTSRTSASDHSRVSRVIDTLLRNDAILIDEVGFAPLDETGTQLLFRLVGGRLRTAQPRFGQPLAIRGLEHVPADSKYRGRTARPAAAPLGGERAQ